MSAVTGVPARLAQVFVPREAPRVRLYCFPYAGGGASAYRWWPAELPAEVELAAIQMPGREERLNQPPFERLESLLDALVAELGEDKIPAAFFGHSMGALIAWELARRLHGAGATWVRHLFLSGCRPVRMRDPMYFRLHKQPEERLLAELRRLGGTPEDILRNEEFLDLMLPTLRADFRLIGEYRFDPEATVDVPLTALGGDTDPSVSSQHVRGWQRCTTTTFEHKIFSGNHFYFHDTDVRRRLLALIGARLLEVALPDAGK